MDKNIPATQSVVISDGDMQESEIKIKLKFIINKFPNPSTLP
jgi:hypothetical protein